MPVTNITEARREAARRNGAKSKGPITPEGKAASARNGIRHGLAVRATVLPWESQDSAAELLAAFTQKYNPVDPAESHMVEMLAIHQWQHLRALSIQQGLLKNAESKTEDTFRKDFANADRDSRTAETFRHLVTKDSAFHLALRYAAEARRAFSAKVQGLKGTQAPRLAGGPTTIGSLERGNIMLLAPPPINRWLSSCAGLDVHI